jgi:FMN-dependent NADH-azoreductase
VKNILFIQSSPRGQESYSQKVARSIVEDLQRHCSDANVVSRNLADNPLPHVGAAFVGGLKLPPAQQTPEQAKALALSDLLVDELAAADILVLGVPMHNFGIPSTLKAWIDHVVRAGRTFSYTPQGPKGLLQGKRAIVVLASGGVYSSGPMKLFDFQEPYLRAVLQFIGIMNVNMVRVEGIGMGEIGAEKALGTAMEQSREMLAQVA